LTLALLLHAGAGGAETTELKIAQQHGLPYVPLMMMESDKLVEAAARDAGLDDVSVKLVTLGGAAAGTDALLSGSVDIITAGVPSVATLWAKSKGTPNEILGLTALESMPWYLVTRNPAVKTIADFTEKDRIALPAVKLTAQALVLEMAAAKLWGEGAFERLDPLTVQMDHPTAVAALLGGKSEVTAHFGVPPYHWEALASPNVHTVLRSYDVVGGPHTVGVLITSRKFHDANPKLIRALLAAQDKANAIIAENPRKAAETYLRLTNDKRTPVETMRKWIADPEITFKSAPERVQVFTDFMHRIGRLSAKPASWKELFFPEAHDLQGS
jgi:NitT/TauT family transport system substrate-binding protein